MRLRKAYHGKRRRQMSDRLSALGLKMGRPVISRSALEEFDRAIKAMIELESCKHRRIMELFSR